MFFISICRDQQSWSSHAHSTVHIQWLWRVPFPGSILANLSDKCFLSIQHLLGSGICPPSTWFLCKYVCLRWCTSQPEFYTTPLQRWRGCYPSQFHNYQSSDRTKSYLHDGSISKYYYKIDIASCTKTKQKKTKIQKQKQSKKNKIYKEMKMY